MQTHYHSQLSRCGGGMCKTLKQTHYHSQFSSVGEEGGMGKTLMQTQYHSQFSRCGGGMGKTLMQTHLGACSTHEEEILPPFKVSSVGAVAECVRR